MGNSRVRAVVGITNARNSTNNFIGKLLLVSLFSDYINHPGRTVRLGWFRSYTNSWYLEDVLFDNFTKISSH